MKFLHGSALTREIKSVVKTRSELKIAVAYWGKDALTRTNISSKRSNIKLLCCLKGGKSDPDIIKKFGRRIRQYDNLHAKVIWTSNRAIVSSANMSSNGLPAEEGSLKGLIEAGVVVTEPNELDKISRWFDKKYKSARSISLDDLRKAAAARPVGGQGNRSSKQGFIQALRNSPQEFRTQKIAFALWKYPMTRADYAGVRRLFKDDPTRLEENLVVPRREFSKLDQYSEWTDIPSDTYLIDCRYKGGRITGIYVTKTFYLNRKWKILVDGEASWVNFALPVGAKDFSYKLSSVDKEIIRKSSRALWNKLPKSKRGEGGVLQLRNAASILLRNA